MSKNKEEEVLRAPSLQDFINKDPDAVNKEALDAQVLGMIEGNEVKEEPKPKKKKARAKVSKEKFEVPNVSKDDLVAVATPEAIAEAEARRADQVVNADVHTANDLMSKEVLDSEVARIERLKRTLAQDGDEHGIKAATRKGSNGGDVVVNPNAVFEDDDEYEDEYEYDEEDDDGDDYDVDYQDVREPAPTPPPPVKGKKKKKKVKPVVADDDDMLPGFTDAESATERFKNLNVDPLLNTEEEEEDESMEELRAEILELDVVTYEDDDETPIRRIKDKSTCLEVVGRKPKKSKLSDDSFDRQLRSFQEQTYATVSVPLVNSGFRVHIRGIGITDLTALYQRAGETTKVADYSRDKLKLVLKSITGTTPALPASQVSPNIAYADYTMLTYGLLCATLAEVNTMITCTKCGESMRITADPADLLLNNELISSRAAMIDNTTDPTANSLRNEELVCVTESGFEVTIRLPSYMEAMKTVMDAERIQKTLGPMDAQFWGQIYDVLQLIVGIRLPNGIVSNNMLQHFKVLKAFNDNEIAELTKIVRELSRKVIKPQFGLRKITCTNCSHVTENHDLGNVGDLLFMHTMVRNILEEI